MAVQPCHLLGIAPELRNNIYRLALTTDGPIKIDRTFNAHIALLETCAQVRSEALQIFYSENEFSVVASENEMATFANWPKALGANTSIARSIHITIKLSPTTLIKFLWSIRANRNLAVLLSEMGNSSTNTTYIIIQDHCPHVRKALGTAMKMGIQADVIVFASIPPTIERGKETRDPWRRVREGWMEAQADAVDEDEADDDE